MSTPSVSPGTLASHDRLFADVPLPVRGAGTRLRVGRGVIRSPVGQNCRDSGRLSLRCDRISDSSSDRTVVTRAEATLPFRFQRGVTLDRSRPDVLSAYVLSLGGGIGCGDDLRIDVELGQSARLIVETPGATRLLTASDGPTRQQVGLRVGSDAYLEVWPQPTIACAGSDHRQETRLALAPDAVALVADVFVVGRIAAGERHAYERYRTVTTLTNEAGRLLARDALVLDPKGGSAGRPGSLADRNVLATVYLAGERLPTGASDVFALLEEPRAGVVGGWSALPNRAGLVGRILAQRAEEATRILDDLRSRVRVLLDLPQPAGRRY